MPDLIDDGTWREAALARMSEVFVTNRGLRPMYMLMARAHRYAIDYIEQAPVIVLAAALGNAHVSPTERAFKALTKELSKARAPSISRRQSIKPSTADKFGKYVLLTLIFS